MSFDWKKHAECRVDYPILLRDSIKCCNADRATMIAEGERLQAKIEVYAEHIARQMNEIERLRAELIESHERESRWLAGNARLREALEYAKGWIPEEEFIRNTPLKRAALSGETVQPAEKQSGDTSTNPETAGDPWVAKQAYEAILKGKTVIANARIKTAEPIECTEGAVIYRNVIDCMGRGLQVICTDRGLTIPGGES